MSMLTFYLNRAGRRLPGERRRTLNAAKDELRSLYGSSITRRGGGPRWRRRPGVVN